MKKPESLDELVSRKAVEFADQIRAAASMADKEEEIRIEAERQLAFIEREAGIKLEGRHEFTVASGRVDSVYDRVIIEYKNPRSPGARIGPRADSPGSKKVVEQIKSRFYDLRFEHGQALNTLFGVGLDGNHFIFVRFRDDKWDVQEPIEVNRYSAERFLWALFNLGYKGKPFSPEYLALDFGSAAESSVATGGIRALYNAIVDTDHPKAQTFFSQWKILFGEVCGYDVDNPSDKIKKLAQFYGVPLKGIKAAEMLFAVHTYYALFMKLLASEIVAFFHKLPTPLHNMIRAGTSNKLKQQMEDLELGSIFRHLNITNFLEGDLFAWYTSVWSDPIEKLVRDMVARLDNYNPGTLSEDPASSRDLLKKLYQQLFPKSVRHDLGEYYTPDWLAEHVLNEVGYVGDPDKRLLDPACGSGTFLVVAISRIRAWFDENRERCRYDEGDLCRKMLSNVIGFDLNPLAVMAARTNYLISIRDLIGHVDKVEIPVYLCDSIMTPSEYGGLFAGGLGKSKELKTAPATFIIPTEIATTREDVTRYAEQLEFCIRNGYSPPEFIQRCRDEGLPVSEEMLHAALYEELVRLDKANKNGVWVRIIKNAFAPLFIGRVDYVAGNPPWVNWSNLPEEYRTSTAPIWEKYKLFPHKGLRARTGSAMDDISALMTYVSLDAYTSADGVLGFVITQSVFKTEGGGEGFRNFRLSATEPIKVVSVSDLSFLQPFEGATNRTATIVLRKGFETSYPVDYKIWRPHGTVSQTMTLDEVKAAVRIFDKEAQPVSPAKKTSPWIVGTSSELAAAQKCFGPSDYQGRYGTHCHASGLFWVEVLRHFSKGKLLIRNLGDVGKTKYPSIEGRVDAVFVHALARGRDVDRWSVASRCSMIMAQDPDNPSKAVDENTLRKRWPDTFQFFKHFEKDLRARSGYKKFFRQGVDPFYSVYNVGGYTFAPYKVLWREVAQDLRAGVSDGTEDPLVPDHTLVSVAVETLSEGHYLCSMLNNSLANYIVMNYVALHPAPHILKYIKIPKYRHSDSTHRRLASLSSDCHKAVANGDTESVTELESLVDEAAAKLWGVSSEELRAIQHAVAEDDEQ